MNKVLTKGRIAWLIIFVVLVIDQVIKIWIKTHMYWHESIRVTDWFYIYFTENNGMAFGMEIFGKLFLGALGNIVDSVFYGVLFNESTYSQIASFLPEEGGYAPLFYGRVVDMLYFPIIDTHWPEWMPLVGGERFIFFSPIFNFADTAISCGIIALLLFYSKYLNTAYHVAMQKDGQKA